MTCTIARHPSAFDTFGQPNAAATDASGVACYWWSGTPSRSADAASPGVVAIESEHLLFAPATDVLQGDHITTVADHLGAVVFSAANYRVVEHVAVMRNHLDCTLRVGKPIGGRA
jgi:hypothetical protein